MNTLQIVKIGEITKMLGTEENKVLQWLQENGPATIQQIAMNLGETDFSVLQALTMLAKEHRVEILPVPLGNGRDTSCFYRAVKKQSNRGL